MVFPFWEKPSETEMAAMRAAREEQLAEHEAAIQRIAEAQRTGGVTPPDEYPDEPRTATR